ncbi:hypothetical protein Q5425_03190 [Amycolatopsis sp. A133]|uniref:hypothetical protein n=1 Tax=Amycolatopsis sp. A133 TaxID=3064472 RepID=UPI0027FF8D8C|nr:hypothetical protein [Amycolatopsis sp. A133]MDQ7802719.1 hypothetical protein [Amycolatopsis sp. A133]
MTVGELMTSLDLVREAAVKGYQDVTSGTNELTPTSAPGVEVIATEPSWLGTGWRGTLTIVALIAAVAGIAGAYRLSVTKDAAETGIVVCGVFALTGLMVAYLTVGGFAKAEFAIGSAKRDSAENLGDDEKPEADERAKSGSSVNRVPPPTASARR